MANNHKQESVNIYTKEFKAKLKQLVQSGNFPREILFNGGIKPEIKNGVHLNNISLTFEEQEQLSRKFKRFVSENIICLMNHEVEFILNYNEVPDDDKPFSWDDVENTSRYEHSRMRDEIQDEFYNITKNPEDSEEEIEVNLVAFLSLINEDIYEENKTHEQLNQRLINYLRDLDDDELRYLVDDYHRDLNIYDLDEYEEHQEVYQWFLVSSYLVELLNKYEEVTITSHNYWGRTCCGQSVELDCVVQDIFLEIWTREF